jgi:hypothetical protein
MIILCLTKEVILRNFLYPDLSIIETEIYQKPSCIPKRANNRNVQTFRNLSGVIGEHDKLLNSFFDQLYRKKYTLKSIEALIVCGQVTHTMNFVRLW